MENIGISKTVFYRMNTIQEFPIICTCAAYISHSRFVFYQRMYSAKIGGFWDLIIFAGHNFKNLHAIKYLNPKSPYRIYRLRYVRYVCGCLISKCTMSYEILQIFPVTRKCLNYQIHGTHQRSPLQDLKSSNICMYYCIRSTCQILYRQFILVDCVIWDWMTFSIH